MQTSSMANTSYSQLALVTVLLYSDFLLLGEYSHPLYGRVLHLFWLIILLSCVNTFEIGYLNLFVTDFKHTSEMNYFIITLGVNNWVLINWILTGYTSSGHRVYNVTFVLYFLHCKTTPHQNLKVRLTNYPFTLRVFFP